MSGMHLYGHLPKKRSSLVMLVMILCASVFLSACVQGDGARAKVAKASGSNLKGGAATGSTSLPNNTGLGSTDSLLTQKIELSHLVDPFDGTYKKKLTIPKNFKGNLYLAGLNVSSLADKVIKVRFNFGADRQAVVLDATLARAPGIVPKTDIQVLVIDMNSKPFSKMRLGYDLYDYNDYSITDPLDANYKDVVTDPRDGNLYCRGLQLEDDPTFVPLTSTSSCSALTDKCLYAYAKVTDATLYDATTGLTNVPSRSQVWTEASGVRNPTITTAASSMCLPDYDDVSAFNDLFGTSLVGLNYNDLVLTRKYRGPYRAISGNTWKIQGSAIFNPTKGLFEVTNSGLDPYTGFRSLMFPRAGKLSLAQDINYFGSTDRFGVRSSLVSDSTGTTKYVDGCNLRVINFNPASAEGIGSCNVSASIEVFYIKENREINITTDRTIKLQLVRASTTNFEGKEVLNTAFKRCESSTTCGGDECCFNSRCWSKELVTQCVDQTPVIGNQEIGANCTSDFECSSLCCNQSTGSCAPHNPNGSVPVLCSKTAGQRCVSRQFCKPEYVATCKVVKLPTPNPDGTVACTLRCPAVETYGDCKAGFCIPPVIPPVPTFDPTDCSNAVDP